MFKAIVKYDVVPVVRCQSLLETKQREKFRILFSTKFYTKLYHLQVTMEQPKANVVCPKT